MDDILFRISQYWGAALLIVFAIFFWPCFILHFYKIKRMLDNDAKFEEWFENGIIRQKSHHRNIWDLSLCPALSKLFFKKDWKLAMAVYLLISF